MTTVSDVQRLTALSGHESETVAEPGRVMQGEVEAMVRLSCGSWVNPRGIIRIAVLGHKPLEETTGPFWKRKTTLSPRQVVSVHYQQRRFNYDLVWTGKSAQADALKYADELGRAVNAVTQPLSETTPGETEARPSDNQAAQAATETQ